MKYPAGCLGQCLAESADGLQTLPDHRTDVMTFESFDSRDLSSEKGRGGSPKCAPA